MRTRPISDLMRMAIPDRAMFGRKVEKLRLRARSYRMAFGGMEGQNVLHDLAEFCLANESCFHPDPRLHAVAEGRREVWLRIQRHMNLTPEQLLMIYDRRHFQPTPEEDTNA